MSFPRYPAYKDSGVEWLGQVPEHWSVITLKRDLDFLTSGSRGWAANYADEGALFLRIGNLSRNDPSLDLADIQRVEVPDGAEAERTRVRPGDVLFSITAYLGSVAVIPSGLETAYVSQHIALARLAGRVLLPPWVGYVTLSNAGQAYPAIQGYGGTKIQLSLDDVAGLLMTAPPLAEQQRIVDFLDRETAKIDALVAEYRTLIELLKEKRQAVISHAVTKGLDPTVPMKDSGVEWLGTVPTHWEVLALSRITSERCDGPFGISIKSEHYTDNGARVIRLQNIRAGRFDGTDEAFLDLDYFEQELSGHDVIAGDVLIAGLGDENNQVGRACVAPEDLGPALVKADCFRFRVRHEGCRPSFIATQLSAGASFDGGYYATGTTRQRIPLSVTGRRRIVLPPVAEQRAIAGFLDRETAKLDALITEAEQAISLLQERRTALISAAVTGKIDVRGLVDRDEAA